VSTVSEIFSTVLCFTFAVALIIAPIYISVVGHRLYKAKKEENTEVVAKYKEIFDGKRVENWFSIQYTTIFFLRRYIIMLAIVIWP
jgi:hypothetical protein